MKTLTKSRFKLGLECPNKLYYTRKKDYTNKKQEDPFLQALAQGGFQVEELARMHYPNGVPISGNDWGYELLLWQQIEIDELSSALLKYCELDTLAMVMIFEHFKELVEYV